MSTQTLIQPLSDRDGRPAQRWAVTAAHLVPLVTLPAALWRLPVAFGSEMGTGAHVELGWESVYILGLSVVTEALALLTLGLVRPWGERPPAWLPAIGGRRVPPLAAIVPAALGALMLMALWGYAFRDALAMPELEFTHEAWHVVLIAAYSPLLLWGPLLALVTFAYWQRRCRD
jgi:hypothetical protein